MGSSRTARMRQGEAIAPLVEAVASSPTTNWCCRWRAIQGTSSSALCVACWASRAMHVSKGSGSCTGHCTPIGLLLTCALVKSLTRNTALQKYWSGDLLCSGSV